MCHFHQRSLVCGLHCRRASVEIAAAVQQSQVLLCCLLFVPIILYTQHVSSLRADSLIVGCRADSPLVPQLSPLFPHKGENALPALPPPLLRDPGHHSPTERAALLIGKPSIRVGFLGTAPSLAFTVSPFPCRDRTMGAFENLTRKHLG